MTLTGGVDWFRLRELTEGVVDRNGVDWCVGVTSEPTQRPVVLILIEKGEYWVEE